jgi:hypothetical protein
VTQWTIDTDCDVEGRNRGGVCWVGERVGEEKRGSRGEGNREGDSMGRVIDRGRCFEQAHCLCIFAQY